MPDVNLSDYVSKGEFERLQAYVKALEAQVAETVTERDEALEQYGEMMGQLETLKATASAATKLKEDLDAAQGQIRGMKHYEQFSAVAKELGIKEEAIKDVWELGKWKAEGDEPDVKAMKAHFEKTLEGREYLKQPGEPAPKQKLTEDHLGNRGPSKETGAGKLKATYAQLNDLSWMQQHQGEIAKASATGDFEIVDFIQP